MAGTLGITGHRPSKIGGYRPNAVGDAVKKRLREEIEDFAPDLILSGMALGVDQWAAQIACDLGIAWYAYVPYASQAEHWRVEQRREYDRLLKLASAIVFTSTDGYAVWKLQHRNERIVNDCHTLLAVWDGVRHGGTYNCVNYAWTNDRLVRSFNPSQLLLGRP